MNSAQLVQLADRVVTTTRQGLPEAIRTLAAAVPVHYEELPDESVLAEGFEPDILGLFTGNPYGTEYSHDATAPAQIILYLENLWDLSEGDRATFREEVRLTYLHELGHYLGWDEDDLAARGLD